MPFPPAPEFVQAVVVPGVSYLGPLPVVSQSFTGAENAARYVQVRLANGMFQWLGPDQYEAQPQEGCDRCECGVKYWHQDAGGWWFCVDCGSRFVQSNRGYSEVA